MNQATDFENRRRSERKIVTQLLRVIDINSSNLMGNVVNLSQDGFMLISSVPLVQGEVSRVTLELPRSADGDFRISVDARCMWCQKSSYSDDYGAGFRIERVSPEDARRMRDVFGI